MTIDNLAIYFARTIVNIVGHLLVKQVRGFQVRFCLHAGNYPLRGVLRLLASADFGPACAAIPQVIVKCQDLARRQLAIVITSEVLLRKMGRHVSSACRQAADHSFPMWFDAN